MKFEFHRKSPLIKKTAIALLASVDKIYTAAAVVRMAADGLLNLDDPITNWLADAITDRIPSLP